MDVTVTTRIGRMRAALSGCLRKARQLVHRELGRRREPSRRHTLPAAQLPVLMEPALVPVPVSAAPTTRR